MNSKKLRALIAVLMLSALMLCGCSQQDLAATDGTIVNAAEGLGVGNDYPPGTFNETRLRFLEEMFETDVITVKNSYEGSYTISSELNRDTYGDECDYYLADGVMDSAVDDWQIERWQMLIEKDNFTSVEQACIQFTDSSGTRWVRFWVGAKLAVTMCMNSAITFSVPDDVIELVQKQYEELSTRTTELRSVEDTVELLFKSFNDRDAESLNELLVTPVETPVFYNVTDTIETITDIGHVGGFPESWCESPYSNRVMYVKFNRSSKNGDESIIWNIYLVRESADSEWKVAAYGK